MNIITLKAVPREGTGSRASRKARAAGFTPVSVYGHGKDNLSLRIISHDLDKALDSSAQMFMLDIDGHEESCLVKEVQYDTFGQITLHVDFARIDLSEEVHVDVALDFIGNPAGVLAGGILAVAHQTLPITCRADSIPASIEVDISEVEIGHALHAGEVGLPEGITLDTGSIEPEAAVVSVTAPKVEEPEPTDGDEEAGEGAAPAEGGADAEPKADGDGDGDSSDG